MDLKPLTIGGVFMSDKPETPPPPPVDERGRIRTPMSPATWTADEAAPASQTPEGEKVPETEVETPKKTTTKKAS